MPDWKSLVQERLRPLRLRAPAELDLTVEIAQHLEDHYCELLSGGTAEEEAYQRTLSELDDIHPLRAGIERSERMAKHDAVPAGDTRAGNLMEDFWRDIRFGGRAIRKSPLFALAAVLCLGVGIGANTTVFTIINTVLLHPLPASDPSRLVVLYDPQTDQRTQQWSQPGLSYANLQNYMEGQKCFSSVAAFTWPQVLTLTGPNGPERMFGELVSQKYFDTLGLRPAIGRFFLPSEDSAPGSAPVAVLSYSAWQARFGGAREVLGRTLELNNTAFTVIGVAPKNFLGVSAVFGPDVWLPATMSERVLPAEFRTALSDRAQPLFRGVARLRDGFSRERAQVSLDPLATALARDYPESDKGHGISVRPITDELFTGAGGAGGLTLASAVLLLVVLLVLGIACSNVANLLLARAESRRHEIGLRLAIGASRGRLVRQLLTESALLSLVSCVAGVGLGYAGCHFVWSFVPAEVIHNMVAPKFDGGVLGFAVLVSLITVALFGLAPALRASRIGVVAALKEETAAAGRSRRTLSFTNALVTGQVAFSMVCLITAALFFRSIERAYTIDPGFQTGHLALVVMDATQAGYNPERAKEFYRATRERIASLPGVESASWASGMPFWNNASRSVVIEGAETRKKSEDLQTVSFIVSTDYFRTMEIPLVAGRTFNDDDREESLPVAAINQALAAQRWPGGDALGRRFHFVGDDTWRQVVGVVKNANYSTLGEAPQPCVYLPQKQNFTGDMTLYVRSPGNPASLLLTIQREVRALDSNIEISDARTGAMLLDQVLWGPKVGVALLGMFGSLALLLASVGLYGVMAYSVTRRRREIGLRMALGAMPGTVLRLVVGDGMRLVGWGIVLGLAASLALDRGLSHMLFGISPADPVSLASASGTLMLVALAACYLPARAATRIDPMKALRQN
jgi:macrolide transport system ATP-binding/permease protein